MPITPDFIRKALLVAATPIGDLTVAVDPDNLNQICVSFPLAGELEMDAALEWSREHNLPITDGWMRLLTEAQRAANRHARRG